MRPVGLPKGRKCSPLGWNLDPVGNDPAELRKSTRYHRPAGRHVARLRIDMNFGGRACFPNRTDHLAEQAFVEPLLANALAYMAKENPVPALSPAPGRHVMWHQTARLAVSSMAQPLLISDIKQAGAAAVQKVGKSLPSFRIVRKQGPDI